MIDRFDQWRLFVAIATHRSFVHAARALGKSPQVATRAVAALEARVGARLLNRTTRAVSLTSEGERYLAQCRRALVEIDLLDAPIDPDAPLRGLVTVTAPVLFGQLHVLPVITELLGAHPLLDARLSLADCVVSLAEEGVDVAVRIGGLADSSAKARLVGHVRSVVCASTDYLERAGRPRTPESLANHACIAFSATTPVPDRWSFRKEGQRERRVVVRPRLTVNTGQAAIEAALAGLGIVRVLSYQVDALIAEKRLETILRAYEPRPSTVYILKLPGVPSRAATAFSDLAAARLRRRLGTLRT